MLARTALVMEASGVPEWDGEICRVCEQALAGDDLPCELRARVLASRLLEAADAAGSAWLEMWGRLWSTACSPRRSARTRTGSTW